ncbi:hypothetical protein AAEX28_06525 [Lentisphaerota bacterium WC36G]|nr:hypothetical protein LJT99_09390 [Lentisphaerae bacterium WC36]
MFTRISRKKSWLAKTAVLFTSVYLTTVITACSTTNKDAKAPKIVATYPKNLTNDVPFGKMQVSVTFDQAMGSGYSWCSNSKFAIPQSEYRPYYSKDLKTCYRDVVLEPDTIYYTSFNAKKFESFRAKDTKKPSKPYVLIFATKTLNGKPGTIPQEIIDKVNAQNNCSEGIKKFVEEKENRNNLNKKPISLNRPKIVKTYPKTLTNNVDAGAITLSVEFDQKMVDGAWSWCNISQDTFPLGDNKPFFNEDKKICKLKATVEPGKVYWIGFNSTRYNSFSSASKYNFRAMPYILVFATKDKNGKPTPIPEKYINAVKKVNESQQ